MLREALPVQQRASATFPCAVGSGLMPRATHCLEGHWVKCGLVQRSWLIRAGGWLWAVIVFVSVRTIKRHHHHRPSAARRVLRSPERLQQPSGEANVSPPRIFSTNPFGQDEQSRIVLLPEGAALNLLSIVESTKPKQVYGVKLDFVSERTIKEHHHLSSGLSDAPWLTRRRLYH
jgi:hypothetical protein